MQGLHVMTVDLEGNSEKIEIIDVEVPEAGRS
jgi:hypothetical protein